MNRLQKMAEDPSANDVVIAEIRKVWLDVTSVNPDELVAMRPRISDAFLAAGAIMLRSRPRMSRTLSESCAAWPTPSDPDTPPAP